MRNDEKGNRAGVGGAPERDILWSLIRWVEDDVAVFTRTLSPFPQRAWFSGAGNSSEAGSFDCKSDPALSKLLQ